MTLTSVCSTRLNYRVGRLDAINKIGRGIIETRGLDTRTDVHKSDAGTRLCPSLHPNKLPPQVVDKAMYEDVQISASPHRGRQTAARVSSPAATLSELMMQRLHVLSSLTTARSLRYARDFCTPS